ncbi:hypothetical protein ACOSQ4_003834 [Xanthoceras sorbifolium]
MKKRSLETLAPHSPIQIHRRLSSPRRCPSLPHRLVAPSRSCSLFRSSNSNVDASRAILSCGGGGECPVSEQPIQVDKYKVREAKLWENYQQELHVAVEKTELELYLLENCEPANTKFDILSWWKNSCTKYPILSCIAKDVFAMQVSTVASESAFSTSGRILDPFRSSLTPKLVEGLICSQNWLQATFPISEPETLVLDVHAQKEDNCVQNEELYEAVQNDFTSTSSTSRPSTDVD